ncbi:hypothetical protein GYH30_055147 [Glycine max]|nr:hypothetical protein GYH30_055147 [Glycine max]
MSQKASSPSELEHLDQALMDHILCKPSVYYSPEKHCQVCNKWSFTN